MVANAEEFILDVRRAARLEQKPTVATDAQLIDPDESARALQRAALWLTPKVVANYDPSAFPESSTELQEELGHAVEQFRSVARSVRPDRPANALHFREGVAAFDRLKAAVRNIVKAEWEAAANALVAQVEAWAQQCQWLSRREPKPLRELLIGDYVLDRLYVYAEGNLYVLDPLARFIPGGLGAFDLSFQPSFEVTSIYRHTDRVWYVHLNVRRGSHFAKRVPLTLDSFRESVAELRSAA